jgi:hypothetical protein
MLFVFNIKILKLPNRIFYSILILAAITNMSWLLEVLVRGWRGLYWLEYTHIAIFIIGVLFLCWLIFINKENKNEKNKKDILFYGTLYALFSVIFIIILKLTFGHVKINNAWTWIFSDIPDNFVHYVLCILLQMFIMCAINILIAKYEKIKISVGIVCLIICSMIIIPIFTFLASFIILNDRIMHLFTIFGLAYAFYFDPIDWIKLGTIIFVFVLYECFYIAYCKKREIIIEYNEMVKEAL